VDLGVTGWGCVDWFGLAQYRRKWRVLVNAVMNFRIPLNAGNLLSGYTTGGLTSSERFRRVI
jgi:hypothetical protein